MILVSVGEDLGIRHLPVVALGCFDGYRYRDANVGGSILFDGLGGDGIDRGFRVSSFIHEVNALLRALQGVLASFDDAVSNLDVLVTQAVNLFLHFLNCVCHFCQSNHEAFTVISRKKVASYSRNDSADQPWT